MTYRERLRNVREISIVYNIKRGLDSPFVQTFFDGMLDKDGQKILKSPNPICPKTKKPYLAHDLYNLHVRKILRILKGAKLDGGGFSERKSGSVWQVRFILRERQPRHVG